MITEPIPSTEQKSSALETGRAVFTDVASLASIIGLILTIFVARSVKALRSRFELRIRLPEVVNDLNAIVADLVILLRDGPNERNKILPHVARSEALVRTVRRRLTPELQAAVDKYCRTVKQYREKNADGWRVYSHLLELLEELTQTSKDIQWSGITDD